jgi:hypothetical protein
MITGLIPDFQERFRKGLRASWNNILLYTNSRRRRRIEKSF